VTKSSDPPEAAPTDIIVLWRQVELADGPRRLDLEFSVSDPNDRHHCHHPSLRMWSYSSTRFAANCPRASASFSAPRTSSIVLKKTVIRDLVGECQLFVGGLNGRLFVLDLVGPTLAVPSCFIRLAEVFGLMSPESTSS